MTGNRSETSAGVSWLGRHGWERLGKLMTAAGESGSLRMAENGFIGIDLRNKKASSGPADDAPREWNQWLANVFPGEKLWFGDRLGSHLWICAEIPADRQVSGEAYLSGLARNIRDQLSGAGRLAGEASQWLADRGFGVAVLAGRKEAPLKDIVYDAFIKAVIQMEFSLIDHPKTELRAEMEMLLRERRIRSVYQPIAWLGDGRVFGYEALTRCPDDSLFEGPLSLFSFAEREGYSFALDRLAREKAIHGSPVLSKQQKIFINVTMGIMNDPRFVTGQTVQWLRQRGLHPGQVVFELTERSSYDDFDAAKQILSHYRSQGYQIAIDDAGAGYSSLQSIVELRPDYIKVDKSLVQNADRDEMKKQMLRTFVQFAKRMNIRTVAEGIEREEELKLVRAMGVDFGQGYLIGRPDEQGVEKDQAGTPNG